MKKIPFTITAFCLLVSIAKAGGEPVEHRIIKFYDNPEYQGWSVVELEMRNKGGFLWEVVFFCQLKNASGYTWTGNASALNVKPGERRTVKIPNEGDSEYFNRPISAKCIARPPSEGHYTFVD